MDKNMLGLNEFLQPINAPISNKQKQTQAVTFEKENILPTGYVNYTNLNQSTRPYTAVLSLSREAGTFDDIQEAINYVNNQGGGRILIKKGTYYLTANITLYDNLFLVGEDSVNCIFDSGNFNFGFDCTNIFNFGFDKVSFSNKSGATGFLDFTTSEKVSINECTFSSNDVDITFQSTSSVAMSNCSSTNAGIHMQIAGFNGNIINNKISSCGTAYYSTVQSGPNTFIGNQINGTVGLSGTFFLTKFQSNSFSVTDYAVNVSNATRFIFANNTIFGSKGLLLGTVTNSQIVGNNIYPTSSHGISLVGCSANQLNGNFISTFIGGTNIYNAVQLTSNSDTNAISGNYLQYGGTATAYSLNIGAGCDFNAVAGNVLSGGTLDSGASNVWAGNAN